MWWGWWAQEDRELTAAVQNTRRNAPARQLAHGVAERASRQQQQLQQRGGKEVMEKADVSIDQKNESGVVAERRRKDVWLF